MRTLTVKLKGSSRDAGLMTYPVELFTPDGDIVGRGVVAPGRVVSLEYPMEVAKRFRQVYVVARRPDGSVLQKRASTTSEVTEVQLTADSPESWLDWATSLRSLSHLREQPRTSGESFRIGTVWMKVWRLADGHWLPVNEAHIHVQRSQGVRQATVEVGGGQFLMQIGGENVAWRFVGLPFGGPVRVAVTRAKSSDGDPVDITVGREHDGYEGLMSYLDRGALTDAKEVGQAGHLADRALYGKFDDPVAAVAGAYLLYRLGHIAERANWLKRLDRSFPDIPDGPLIVAAAELLVRRPRLHVVRSKVRESISRGFPIFSTGLRLLVEVMAAIHIGDQESRRFKSLYAAAQVYLGARTTLGPYFSFFGRMPTEPSTIKLKGLDGKPAVEDLSSRALHTTLALRASRAPKSTKAFGGCSVSLQGPRISLNDFENQIPEHLFLPNYFEISSDIGILQPPAERRSVDRMMNYAADALRGSLEPRPARFTSQQSAVELFDGSE